MNPFQAPLSIPFSGNTDGTGAYTFPTAIREAFWSVVKVIGKTQGASTSWEIQQAGGIPLDFATGPRCSLGPFILGPTDRIKVLVTGALPNGQVVGQLVGAQYADRASAVAALAMTANPLTVSTVSQRVTLYPDGTASSAMGAAPTFPSFTMAANGGPSTFTFTIKPTQTNLRIEQSGSTQFRIQVAGHQTGVGYLPSVDANGASNFVAANSPFRPIDVRVEPSWDSQVDVTITEESGNAASFYVSALFGAETTVIAGATTQIPVFFLPTGQALWQAAKSVASFFQLNLAGGATATLVAAVAGQTVYLHDFNYAFDTSTATNWQLEDSTGAILSYDAGTLVANKPYHFSGLPLVSGRGVQIHNSGAAAQSIRGHLTYSQG